MNNQSKTIEDDNDFIDLGILWHNKIYIILFTIMSVFFTSIYLQGAERKYKVEYKLKPVGE